MLSDAIQKGVRFLVERQSGDHAWRDFALEPGESDAWVTAYVGNCLSQLPTGLTDCDETLDTAAQWLRRNMRAEGGWGYNGECPVDSDSTALAVLFLTARGNPVPDECYQRLLSFQKQDGGFSTFERRDPSNVWGMSHSDVGPAVLLALLTKLPKDHPAICRGLAFSVAALGCEGLWRSYWWTTPLYATLANVVLLEQAGASYARDLVVEAVRNVVLPANSFELALLGETISILDSSDPRIPELVRILTTVQSSDGSWSASADILRVPDPGRRFADSTGGVAALDHHHLLTTATVLRCLSSLMKIE